MSYDAMTAIQLQAEVDRIKAALTEAEELMADLRNRLSDASRALDRRTRPAPEPKCSDHALLRYAQRVHGLDVESIRAEIMTEGVRKALKEGVTAITINNVKFRCKDGVVVTVIADKRKAA